MNAQEDRLYLAAPNFSPDNKTLLLMYGPPRSPRTLALYEFDSGHLSVFQPPQGEEWGMGTFSVDGKQIVFVVGLGNDRITQIATVNLDGTGYRVLTSTQDRKGTPSFSPDGKRLLFAKAGRERTSGRTRFSDYDIYEFDIASKQETRLTEFKFFSANPPAYLPDGEQFIFSAEPLRNSEAYKERFQQNIIFIMSKTNHDLKPAFTRGDYSDAPSISANGSKILFISRSNDLDNVKGNFNYDLFLKTPEGIVRLTKLGSVITQGKISPDGSRVVFLSQKERPGVAFTAEQKRRMRNLKQDLMVMNSDGTGLKTIELPAPDRVITVKGN